MARRPRIEYPGALYHVIARGNQRQRIFVDDSDRRHYLGLLLALKKTCSFHLYTYVLMHNHVHLLMETEKIPLSRIMQRLTGGYTQYFNRRHELSGHLFQGRYKAILCAKDSYLLELSRYIHLNPVRVKAVRDPAKYRWSSYNTYLGGKTLGEFVDVEPVLAYFSKNDGRNEYRKFVLEGIEEGHRAEYYEAAEGRILGDGKFVEEIKTKSGEKERPKLTIKPQAFVEQVCKALGKKPQEVIGAAKNRERVRIRQILSYVGRNCTELQVKVLAATLKVDPTCVSRCVAIVERQLGQDKMLRAEVRRIQNIIYHV
jgi:putative transposase